MSKQRICTQEENLRDCTCSYPGCAKKGICCECIKSHRDQDEIPGCLFPEDAERTYDRSIANFIRTWKDKV